MPKRKPISYGLAVTKLALHSTLTAHQKLVLIAVAEHLGVKDHAWPSYATLARLTSLTRRTVISTVKALVRQGILTICYPPGQRSNCYKPEFQELMNRVSDEQVTARIRERLGELEPADGEGASLSDHPGDEAMVKTLHQVSETPSPDDEVLSPGVVNGFHQDGETAAPERPREASPPKPKVKRPLKRSLRLTPQPKRGGFSAGEGGMTHQLSDAALDNREFLSDYIKSHAYSELIREVEVRLNNPVEGGNSFCFKSKVPLPVLAGKMTAFLVQLDQKPTWDDILSAINDEQFSGLKGLSWGLLLSDQYRPRFKWLVKKFQERRLNPHGPDLHCWSSHEVVQTGHRLFSGPLDE